MTIQEAKQAGVAAYNEGRHRAPAMNQAFLVAACASPTKTSELLAAYVYGFDIANLADDALPGMPSIGELERICE